jgi:hypothetical protein
VLRWSRLQVALQVVGNTDQLKEKLTDVSSLMFLLDVSDALVLYSLKKSSRGRPPQRLTAEEKETQVEGIANSI